MKLVFYGGGVSEENVEMDKQAVSLTNKSYPQLTYIPSASFDGEIDFKEFVANFIDFEITRFIYFPVDVPFDQVLLEEAFKSDIIHLGGGNTYYFLSCLRKNRLLPKLRAFVKRGGVLTGLSAGGIIMTPSIETAGFPKFDRDENEEGIKNLNALNLVKFEFFPHYKNSRRYDESLLKHSRKKKHPVIACADGAGLVVNEKKIELIGKSFIFYQGKKLNFSL